MIIRVSPRVAAEYTTRSKHIADETRSGTALPIEYDPVLAERIASAYETVVACMTPDEAVAAAESDHASADAIVERQLEEILTSSPDEDAARWGIVAEELVYASNDFGQVHLEYLASRNISNVRWLIAGAAWVLTSSGIDPTGHLLDSFHRIVRNTEELRAVFRAHSVSRDVHLRTMASLGLGVLDGFKLGELSSPGWWRVGAYPQSGPSNR